MLKPPTSPSVCHKKRPRESALDTDGWLFPWAALLWRPRLAVERVMSSWPQALLRQRLLQALLCQRRMRNRVPLSLHPEQLAQRAHTHQGPCARCHARPARTAPRELGHPAGLRQPSLRPPHAFLPVTCFRPCCPVPASSPPEEGVLPGALSVCTTRPLRPAPRHGPGMSGLSGTGRLRTRPPESPLRTPGLLPRKTYPNTSKHTLSENSQHHPKAYTDQLLGKQ